MSETASTSFTVPVVDISACVAGGTPEQRAAVAAAVDEAARTVGFLQVVGHQIPAGLWEGLGQAIDDFFALPLAAKKAYVAGQGVNRGYTAPRSERLALSLGVERAERMNDFFEAFNVGVEAAEHPDLDLDATAYADNLWPQEVPGFRERVQEWTAHARATSRVLLAIFAEALELPEGFFDSYVDHSLDVLRMNNYALPPGQRVEVDGDLIGMGEHTDFGIVTLLWADDVPGLQVLSADGSWHDVAPLPGALLVNLGDLTARWTNERWTSTLHRVKPPLVDGTIRRRRSAAYFCDGNHEAVIAALSSCVPAGQAPLHPPITVAEHIGAKLAGSRGGTLNEGAQHDAARVVAARG